MTVDYRPVTGPGNLNSNLLFTPDNAFDIGSAGSTNRPRAGYFGTSLSAPYVIITSRGQIGGGSVDGQLTLFNIAGTDFGRLQFGGSTDTFGAIARDGAGISIVGAAGGSTGWLKIPPVAVASLPAAATAGAGARAFVNDALAPVFGSAVAGGGAIRVPVYSTGSAWNVG